MQSEGFRSGQASGPLAETRHSRVGGNPGALFGTNTDHKKKPDFLGSGLCWNDARETVFVWCLIAMMQNKTRLLSRPARVQSRYGRQGVNWGGKFQEVIMPEMTTRPVIMGTRGVVTSGHYLATAAGFRIMEQGGNAIDAAVTCAFTQGILSPHSCGIGGYAVTTIHLADGSSISLDAKRTATPSAASWSMS